jgi:hypothetical protein
MTRKKPCSGLPWEVLAVLECSPNLVLCKKFYHANTYRMADHLKEGKCEQCLAFYRQTEKELKTMRLLAVWRNAKNN